MDKKTKNDFINLFNQGFGDVVVPALDRLEEELKQEISALKSKVDNMDRKFDRVIAKDLDQDDKLENHEKRIKKLEKPQAIA